MVYLNSVTTKVFGITPTHDGYEWFLTRTSGENIVQLHS